MRPLPLIILTLTLSAMNGLPHPPHPHAAHGHDAPSLKPRPAQDPRPASSAEAPPLAMKPLAQQPLKPLSLQPLKLSPLFSDHMVIQHGRETRIWGTASPGERLTVIVAPETMTPGGVPDGVIGHAPGGEPVSATGAGMMRTSAGITRVETAAGADGSWEAMLPAYPPGGPYRIMFLAGSAQTTDQAPQIRDVMFGEVWVAGGQSNMEWKLNWGVDRQAEEIADARYPQIRFFEVPNRVSATPLDEIAGSDAVTGEGTAPAATWKVASPQTVGEFSAVAWFFAKQAHLEKGVPVGILDSNWGGTPAEAWTPAPALLNLEAYEGAAREVLDPAADWQARMEGNAAREREKFTRIPDREGSRRTYESMVMPLIGGKEGVGTAGGAAETEGVAGKGGADAGLQGGDAAAWERRGFSTIHLPTAEEPLGDFAWVVKEVVLAADERSMPDAAAGGAHGNGEAGGEAGGTAGGRLFIDHVMQEAMIFVNGVFVAEKTWMQTAVDLELPEGLLAPGPNTLTLRVANSWDNRVWIGKPGRMWIETPLGRVSLEGPWRYSNTLEPPMPEVARYEWTSSFLYNGMIHPLTRYAVRGAIWYQGEGNTGLPGAYLGLMRTMIGSWREAWGQPDMPFLFVQLANYMARRDEPMESAWAELREAQLKTLDTPATGMAVAIDIGEAEDIHPRNKQDVGRRLWLQARKVAYGEEVLADGPVFAGMGAADGCLVVQFRSVGDGLVSDDGDRVAGFEVAAEDGVFRRAVGRIQGANEVRVCSEGVAAPVHLRYGWADNPHVTLRNSAGLPASPFRTGR